MTFCIFEVTPDKHRDTSRNQCIRIARIPAVFGNIKLSFVPSTAIKSRKLKKKNHRMKKQNWNLTLLWLPNAFPVAEAFYV